MIAVLGEKKNCHKNTHTHTNQTTEEWVHMRGRTKDSLSLSLSLSFSLFFFLPPVALSNQRGRKNEGAISTTSQSISVGPEKGSKTDKTE
jgi:hypothetical protein